MKPKGLYSLYDYYDYEVTKMEKTEKTIMKLSDSVVGSYELTTSGNNVIYAYKDGKFIGVTHIISIVNSCE